MSKNQIRFSLILVVVITLTSTVNFSVSQDTGFDQVDLGPGYEDGQVSFKYGFYNGNITTSADYNEFLSDLRSNFGANSQIEVVSDSIISDETRTTILFADRYNSTSAEISILKSYLNKGGGLLYLSKPGNTSISAQKFVDDLFDTSVINFNNQQINGSLFNVQVPYIVSSDFNSPRTPATINLTKLLIPNTGKIEINNTAVQETNLTVKDIYPIIFSPNNDVLGVAVELTSHGRIVFLASQELFSDKVILHQNEYTSFVTIDNSLFGVNLIKWLGRSSGYANKFSHTLNYNVLTQISRGTIINATVEISDNFNRTIKDAEVTLEFEIFKNTVDSSYMHLEGDKYVGSLSTRNAGEGNQIEFHVRISKRGFLDQTFLLGRYYIIREYNGAALPNFTMLTVLAGSVLIFALTYVLIWQNFRKAES